MKGMKTMTMNITIIKHFLHLSLWLLPLFLITGCGRGEADHDDDHEHGHETATQEFTRYSNDFELFVEFPALVKGKISPFTAHFTRLSDYSPVRSGQVTVSLVSGTSGIRQSVQEPVAPGIFKPALKPENAGIHRLIFDLSTAGEHIRFTIDSVRVFASQEEAGQAFPHEEAGANVVTFLKEQAWKVDFAVSPVKRDSIYDVIHTGGQILPARGDEVTVPATAGGLVIFSNKNAQEGQAVNKGDLLFTIVGGGISDQNIEKAFAQAKASFEKEKAAFERAKTLYEGEAIPKAEFEEAKLDYELAKAAFESVSANFTKGGKQVRAPASGYLKSISIDEGGYAEIGQPLAVITQSRKLTIRADVSPEYFTRLSAIKGANFRNVDGHIYDIAAFNGKLLSYGKSVSKEDPLIPVYFELDNKGNLLPGAAIEVFLKTGNPAVSLTIPASALLENYGRYSVYVQVSGENYEQREVVTGSSDGKRVEILSGLKAGEYVVSKGAFQVKMASMSSQVPAHGHSH